MLELADEVHEIGFQAYQLNCRYISIVDSFLKRQLNPEERERLIQLRGTLSSVAERQAARLDNYVISLHNIQDLMH